MKQQQKPHKLGFFGPSMFKKGPWNPIRKPLSKKPTTWKRNYYANKKTSNNNYRRQNVYSNPSNNQYTSSYFPYANYYGIGRPYYGQNYYKNVIEKRQGPNYINEINDPSSYYGSRKSDDMMDQGEAFQLPEKNDYVEEDYNNENPNENSLARFYQAQQPAISTKSNNRYWQKPWQPRKPLFISKHVQRGELEKHGEDFFEEDSLYDDKRPDLMLPHSEGPEYAFEANEYTTNRGKMGGK